MIPSGARDILVIICAAGISFLIVIPWVLLFSLDDWLDDISTKKQPDKIRNGK